MFYILLTIIAVGYSCAAFSNYNTLFSIFHWTIAKLQKEFSLKHIMQMLYRGAFVLVKCSVPVHIKTPNLTIRSEHTVLIILMCDLK